MLKEVQKCVYRFEGSLNKFLMDDKGSTLIAAFGLPPLQVSFSYCIHLYRLYIYLPPTYTLPRI